MNYLLDSNTYIQAKNVYYDMECCPAYWDWLDLQYASGNLGSITSVYDEILPYGDELSDWINARKDQFLPISDDPTQKKYAEIAQHVYDLPNKNPAKVNGFLSKADPWLIAKAFTSGATIITHERLVPANSKDVKIPNICEDFGLEYKSTFQLLQVLKAKFVLET